MITSAVSVNSTVSASTTSLKKSALKKPKKDVSVSFKQMPDTDTEENEQESLKMNSYNDDSHDEGEVLANEENTKENLANTEENEPEKFVEDKESLGSNTKL